MRYTFDAVWDGDAFRGPVTYEVDGDLLREVTAVGEPRDPHAPPSAATERTHVAATASTHVAVTERTHVPATASTHVGGTLIPHLTDHHTHLGLTDQRALFASGITDAVDLGWIPEVASTWLAGDLDRPAVVIAGALLTSVGGYPVNAGWGPPGSSTELTGPMDAQDAVREQVMLGASRIKVTLNTDAGTTVDNSTLAAIVEEAAASGVPVTVHAQGAGQVTRAIAAGADQLAHAPFSERIGDADLRRASDAGMTWVSTIDIHGWGEPTAASAVAQDNIRRFVEAGGRVLYGTDLGNGPLPVGVNRRELDGLASCGLDDAALMASIATAPAGAIPALPGTIGPRFAWVPTTLPLAPAPTAPAAAGHTTHPADTTRTTRATRTALPTWLATARGLTVATLPTHSEEHA